MRRCDLIIITGMPGTGKTTLARRLARHYAIPLIAKDTIKEPLMDVLGSVGAQSRNLSNLSFAIMFAMAKELLAGGANVILEGNFRAGEHDAPLLAALPDDGAAIVQVLCRADEPERRSRLAGRASDSTRHPGHRDAEQPARIPACDAFLELPGERLVFDNGRGAVSAETDLIAVLDGLPAVP